MNNKTTQILSIRQAAKLGTYLGVTLGMSRRKFDFEPIISKIKSQINN